MGKCGHKTLSAEGFRTVNRSNQMGVDGDERSYLDMYQDGNHSVTKLTNWAIGQYLAHHAFTA